MPSWVLQVQKEEKKVKEEGQEECQKEQKRPAVMMCLMTQLSVDYCIDGLVCSQIHTCQMRGMSPVMLPVAWQTFWQNSVCSWKFSVQHPPKA